MANPFLLNCVTTTEFAFLCVNFGWRIFIFKGEIQMKDEELKEAIDIILVLHKYRYGNFSFEETRELYSQLFFRTINKRVGDREEWEEMIKKYFKSQKESLMRLPKEILETIDDFDKLSFGFMTEETRKLLENHYKEL